MLDRLFKTLMFFWGCVMVFALPYYLYCNSHCNYMPSGVDHSALLLCGIALNDPTTKWAWTIK